MGELICTRSDDCRAGAHVLSCPSYLRRDDSAGVERNTTEYRAVYGHPNGSRSHGEPKATLEEAIADLAPDRAAETLAVVAGVESRPVQPWRPVPLSAIVEEARS